MTEPSRSRAVFSSEDFQLIRDALLRYMGDPEGGPRRQKLANLYHRLGRVG